MLVLLSVKIHAKFEVSSSNGSRDMEGVTKFEKWVTLLTSPLLDPLRLIFGFLLLVP